MVVALLDVALPELRLLLLVAAFGGGVEVVAEILRNVLLQLGPHFFSLLFAQAQYVLLQHTVMRRCLLTPLILPIQPRQQHPLFFESVKILRSVVDLRIAVDVHRRGADVAVVQVLRTRRGVTDTA